MTNSSPKKFSLYIIGALAAIGCGGSAGDDLFVPGDNSNAGGSSGGAGMSGNAGSAGTAGSSGKAGSGGKSGSAGSTGKAGSGGTSGKGGASGTGGTMTTGGSAGVGGTAGSSGGNAGVGGALGGSGGNAGSAGTGNTAGTAQAGSAGSAPACGDGTCNGGENCATCTEDCGICPPTCGDNTCNGEESCSNCAQDCGNCPVASCEAGQNGSVDKITASGAIETAYYLHFNPGTEVYSTEVPTMHQFTGAVGPMQMVLLGKEGIQFDLRNSGTNNQIAKTWYKVESFPSPQCDGLALKSQACLAAVAKAFRCQFSPYNESLGCPTAVTFSAQPAEGFYSHSQVGWQMLLVHLTCPLNGRLELYMKKIVFIRSLIQLEANRLSQRDQARMAAIDSRGSGCCLEANTSPDGNPEYLERPRGFLLFLARERR